MLANINDVFTNVIAISVSNLAVDEIISLLTSSYDAGTEKSSELIAIISGPVCEGKERNTTKCDMTLIMLRCI